MSGLIIDNAVVAAVPGRVVVTVRDGVIEAVDPTGTARRADAEVFDAAGRVLAPAFAEPHLHLDKALLGGTASSLQEAISQTALRKATFTHADVMDRAERVLRMALAAGTTLVRAHTEVDPGVGLVGVDALLQLTERVSPYMRVELAILPQEGILVRPGTLELLRAALSNDGTLVGGCPYVEADVDDARRHIDTVLDLAVDFGRPADLHLDFADNAADGRFALASYLASAVISRGLQGRVAIGHATSLGSLSPAALSLVADRLAAADVAVVVLPATDLFLMGRNDDHDIRRGLAPIGALRRAGVRVALSSNNIRNAFTPSGRADPLDIALLAARVSYAATPADFEDIMRMVTTDARGVIERGAAGVTPGARADLVVFDARDPDAIIHDQPARTAVISNGRLVYQEERRRRWSAWSLESVEDPAA
jgi:cytosine deaminase